jgi:hypothetical protein
MYDCGTERNACTRIKQLKDIIGVHAHTCLWQEK